MLEEEKVITPEVLPEIDKDKATQFKESLDQHDEVPLDEDKKEIIEPKLSQRILSAFAWRFSVRSQ